MNVNVIVRQSSVIFLRQCTVYKLYEQSKQGVCIALYNVCDTHL